MAIDPSLVGRWYSASRTIELTSEGFMHELRSVFFSIDVASEALMLGQQTFGLDYGDANSIGGVWSNRSVVGADLHRISHVFLPTQQYNFTWLINDVLHEYDTGIYSTSGERLEFWMRIGRVDVLLLGTLSIFGSYEPTQSVAYAIAPDGSLTLTLDLVTQTFTRDIMAFDGRLEGTWTSGGVTYVVDASGWYSTVDAASPFEISLDGQTLTFPVEDPVIPLTRLFGTGNSIVGVWKRNILDSLDQFVEEITFRADNSLSIYWTKNGNFDSSSNGSYLINGNQITRTEQYALILTAAPDLMVFHHQTNPDNSGTYTLSADQNTWVFTSSGNAVTYTRVP